MSEVSTEVTRGLGFPEAGVRHCCEPPCRCGHLHSDPLQEQKALLTSEPSLTPANMYKVLEMAAY